MFCDLQGYTTLAERLGPEEVYAIMDEVYEILIHKVHNYEGTVNEMTGDGIMALIGAPIALEDAPQRAIRSSLAMITNLLGTEEIHRKLEDLILEKSEDIPFFIEELIKSLKTPNIIEKSAKIYRSNIIEH